MNARRRPAFHLTPLAAALLCVGTGQAVAQTTAPESPPVLVTAPALRTPQPVSPKATTEALNTPQTINVIPAEVISEQGARTLTEVLRNTPGISFDAGENGFSTSGNNFSLRGFDTSGNIFIDGVRDSGNYARDAYNLEQVEVVKGPAADNGRGGAGGYVNLVTKTPKRDNFFNATLSYGFDSYDSEARKRASLDLNRTLGETSALRLNMLVEDGGIAGRQHADNRSVGVAPSLTVGLGQATQFTAAYQHLNQKGRPDWGIPSMVMPNTFRYLPELSGVSRDNFYGLLEDFDKTTSDALLLRVEHRFSNVVSLSNQTRWSRTEREALYTVPFGYAPATGLVTTQRHGYQRESDGLTNQTNLRFSFNTGGLRHEAAAGLELSQEKSEAGRFPNDGAIGNPGSTDIWNPNPGRGTTGFVGFTPTQTSKVKIDTVALYAYDTVEFSPQWQMTGGLRVERYEVDISSRLISGAPQGPDAYHRTETTVGGKLGLVYKPVPEGSVYFSVGRSALPPGSYLSNPDISREGDNGFPGWSGQSGQHTKEQVSTNVELGLKWEFFNGRLSTTAALFRTERSNIAWTGRDTPGGGATDPVVFQGYGKQLVQGLELGVSGKATANWTIFAGLVVLDSERRHSAFLDQQRKNANGGDYGSYTSTNGDELAFTPKVTANLWTSYRLSNGLTLGGGVRHAGSSWVGRPDTADRVIPNGVYGKLPSYTLVDLMAAYQVNPNFALRLNVDNVADKLYATSANWPIQRVSLGAPRNVVLSANLVF